jgi:hypothetical protein
MFKVIVERPRRGRPNKGAARRGRNDLEGPQKLTIRAFYDRDWHGKETRDHLSPLRRYLRAQVGRPWNQVYSEICAATDRRSAVQRHVLEHIGDYVATQVVAHRKPRQELYVDPRTGLIRPNPARTPKRRGV